MSKKTVTEIKEGKYKFDDASLQYAKLSPKEAKAQVAKVRAEIKDLKQMDTLSQNPENVMRLRELYSTLAWFKANKNRSKYFKVISSGPSMRHANRHPDANIFADKKLTNDTRPKRRKKTGSKRKAVQFIKSLFSRNTDKVTAERERGITLSKS